MSRMPASGASNPLCFAAIASSPHVTSCVGGGTLYSHALHPTAEMHKARKEGTSRRGASALAWGGAAGLIASVARRGRTQRQNYMSNEDIEARTAQSAARNDAKYHRLRQGYANNGVPVRDEQYWEWMEKLYFKRVRLSAGIDFDKYDDVEVEMLGGKGDEEAVGSFQELCQKFELPEGLVANLERCKYAKPTPVQKYSMPAVLSGSDVMVSAQTGSGKTAAFMTPIIATVLGAGEQPLEAGAARPKALILAPTRELCQQLATEAKRLCHRTFIRITSIYGGAPQGPQLEELAEGGHIVIGTPGRLNDFLQRGLLSMKDVQFLAVDEADRMLDMGFEPQIRSIIDESGMPEPGLEGEGRRTMMFSATFPQEMQDMALDFLHPSYLWIGVGRVGEMVSSVDQRFEDLSFGDKQQTLIRIIQAEAKDDGSEMKTIVFANTKRMVDGVTNYLRMSGMKAAPIHGGLTQTQRDGAISALKTGRVSVLVATDVAARGLDIPGVDHVVNFDVPQNAEDYTHRIGRTGRIGNKGVATTFVTGNDTGVKSIVQSLKKAQQADDKIEIPDWLVEKVYS